MAKPMPARSSDFVTYVLDMLAPLGPVASGRMFGGHNLSLAGITFAIIIGDVLFLKTDLENRPAFESLGLQPFSYQKKDGKVTSTSYFTAPDCLDDWDALEPFARGALAAARRAKAPKPRRPPTQKAAPKKLPARKPPARKPPQKKANAR